MHVHAPPARHSDQVLMMPQQPDWTIDDILATNRSAWMLVDKSLITYDGGWVGGWASVERCSIMTHAAHIAPR